MAKNLINSRHNVIVYDVFQQPMEELKDHGAEVADTPATVALKAKRIITMLPSRFVDNEVHIDATGDVTIFEFTKVRLGAQQLSI